MTEVCLPLRLSDVQANVESEVRVVVGREGATRASVFCWSVHRKHGLAQVWSKHQTVISTLTYSQTRKNGLGYASAIDAHDAPQSAYR